MCLHPSNSCRYCHEPCYASGWVDPGPDHWWIDVSEDCIDELPQLTGFDIHQFPQQFPYSDTVVWQSVNLPNKLVWPCWSILCSLPTRTFVRFRQYRCHTHGQFPRSTFGDRVLGTIWQSLPLESVLVRSRHVRRGLGCWQSSVWTISDRIWWSASWVVYYLWSQEDLWLWETELGRGRFNNRTRTSSNNNSKGCADPIHCNRASDPNSFRNRRI